MSGEKKCVHCESPLRFLRREQFQLGRTGWLLGDLPNLLAGSLEMEIWCCPNCGKLEFYVPGAILEQEWGDSVPGRMTQIRCPVCGVEHDLDDPKCPRCGAKNPEF